MNPDAREAVYRNRRRIRGRRGQRLLRLRGEGAVVRRRHSVVHLLRAVRELACRAKTVGGFFISVSIQSWPGTAPAP
jgi:hypothetical protein